MDRLVVGVCLSKPLADKVDVANVIIPQGILTIVSKLSSKFRRLETSSGPHGKG